MKTNYILLIIISLLYVSCNEALEEEVIDFRSTGNFYQNEDDAVAAANAMYRPLQINVYRRWYSTLTELRSDHAKHEFPNPALTSVDIYTMDAANSQNAEMWTGYYSSINLANIVVQRVAEISEIPDGRRNEIVAEGRFVRAFSYFELVRLYGGVPLRLDYTEGLDNIATPRATVDEVYESILADLQFARSNLPITVLDSEQGRPTRGSALGLLAQVYLTLGDFEQAKTIAQEIINTGMYSLLPNYESVFSIDNEGHNEYLFSIKYSNLRNYGSGLPAWFANGGSNNPYGSAAFRVIQGDDEAEIWTDWDENDPRRQYALYETFIGDNGQFVNLRETNSPFYAFGKYRDPIGSQGSTNHAT
ncbi:MAG: RagB/SusD family nutrient uptake outer membrane protein, partial [Cyclobacteriaceae bacterium]